MFRIPTGTLFFSKNSYLTEVYKEIRELEFSPQIQSNYEKHIRAIPTNRRLTAYVTDSPHCCRGVQRQAEEPKEP